MYLRLTPERTRQIKICCEEHLQNIKGKIQWLKRVQEGIFHFICIRGKLYEDAKLSFKRYLKKDKKDHTLWYIYNNYDSVDLDSLYKTYDALQDYIHTGEAALVFFGLNSYQSVEHAQEDQYHFCVNTLGSYTTSNEWDY